MLFFHPRCACEECTAHGTARKRMLSESKKEKKSSTSSSDLLLISSPLWLQMLKLGSELLSAKADFQLRQTVEYTVQRCTGGGDEEEISSQELSPPVQKRKEKSSGIWPYSISMQLGYSSRVQKVFRCEKLMSVQGDIASLTHEAPSGLIKQ